MGRRSRKPRPAAYARAEQRNAEVRATLTPLGPGERPRPLTVATIAALLGAVTYLVPWLAGWRLAGREIQAAGALIPAAILALAAWGMWRQRAWAVLGFMALLVVSILFAARALAVSSNLAGAALCVVVMGLSGWLFWKLVRVLGRLQMPPAPR